MKGGGRKGKELKGKEKKGNKRRGKERKGNERRGKERKGEERKEKERKRKASIRLDFHQAEFSAWTKVSLCLEVIRQNKEDICPYGKSYRVKIRLYSPLFIIYQLSDINQRSRSDCCVCIILLVSLHQREIFLEFTHIRTRSRNCS